MWLRCCRWPLTRPKLATRCSDAFELRLGKGLSVPVTEHYVFKVAGVGKLQVSKLRNKQDTLRRVLQLRLEGVLQEEVLGFSIRRTRVRFLHHAAHAKHVKALHLFISSKSKERHKPVECPTTQRVWRQTNCSVGRGNACLTVEVTFILCLSCPVSGGDLQSQQDAESQR